MKTGIDVPRGMGLEHGTSRNLQVGDEERPARIAPEAWRLGAESGGTVRAEEDAVIDGFPQTSKTSHGSPRTGTGTGTGVRFADVMARGLAAAEAPLTNSPSGSSSAPPELASHEFGEQPPAAVKSFKQVVPPGLLHADGLAPDVASDVDPDIDPDIDPDVHGELAFAPGVSRPLLAVATMVRQSTPAGEVAPDAVAFAVDVPRGDFSDAAEERLVDQSAGQLSDQLANRVADSVPAAASEAVTAMGDPSLSADKEVAGEPPVVLDRGSVPPRLASVMADEAPSSTAAAHPTPSSRHGEVVADGGSNLQPTLETPDLRRSNRAYLASRGETANGDATPSRSLASTGASSIASGQVGLNRRHEARVVDVIETLTAERPASPVLLGDPRRWNAVRGGDGQRSAVVKAAVAPDPSNAKTPIAAAGLRTITGARAAAAAAAAVIPVTPTAESLSSLAPVVAVPVAVPVPVAVLVAVAPAPARVPAVPTLPAEMSGAIHSRSGKLPPPSTSAGLTPVPLTDDHQPAVEGSLPRQHPRAQVGSRSLSPGEGHNPDPALGLASGPVSAPLRAPVGVRGEVPAAKTPDPATPGQDRQGRSSLPAAASSGPSVHSPRVREDVALSIASTVAEAGSPEIETVPDHVATARGQARNDREIAVPQVVVPRSAAAAAGVPAVVAPAPGFRRSAAQAVPSDVVASPTLSGHQHRDGARSGDEALSLVPPRRENAPAHVSAPQSLTSRSEPSSSSSLSSSSRSSSPAPALAPSPLPSRSSAGPAAKSALAPHARPAPALATTTVAEFTGPPASSGPFENASAARPQSVPAAAAPSPGAPPPAAPRDRLVPRRRSEANAPADLPVELVSPGARPIHAVTSPTASTATLESLATVAGRTATLIAHAPMSAAAPSSRSSAVAPATVDLPIASSSPRTPEARRVRAAVLELQHLILDPGNAVNVPSSSRSFIGTPPRLDKKFVAASPRGPSSTVDSSTPSRSAHTSLVEGAAGRETKSDALQNPPAAARAASAARLIEPGARARLTGALVEQLAVEVARASAPVSDAHGSVRAASTKVAAPAGRGGASQVAGGNLPSAEPASAGADLREPAVATPTSSGLPREAREQQQQAAPQPESVRQVVAPLERPLVELQAAARGPSAVAPATPDLRGFGAPLQPGSSGAGMLLELASEDPSLHAAALGKNAHVRLETGKDGDLSLHLQVHDGVVDVRFDGAASRTLDLRSSEIRSALAGEGISLGTFETAPRAPHLQGGALQLDQGGASSGFGSANAGGSSASSNPNTNSNLNLNLDTNNNPNSTSGGGSSDRGTGGGADNNNAAASQAGGGGTSSQSGANLGGGNRQHESGDRWPDRDTSRTLAAAGSFNDKAGAQPGGEPRRRRGFHVTA